jgi:hypothetical protein
MSSEADRDSFYVTCTSSESSNFFPDNETSSFRTRLKEPINLNNYSRKWEVGISSFSYTQEINNFGECMLMELYLFDGVKTFKIPIVDQLKSSSKGMADAISTSLKKIFTIEI